jgi:hypothetical protein
MEGNAAQHRLSCGSASIFHGRERAEHARTTKNKSYEARRLACPVHFSNGGFGGSRRSGWGRHENLYGTVQPCIRSEFNNR